MRPMPVLEMGVPIIRWLRRRWGRRWNDAGVEICAGGTVSPRVWWPHKRCRINDHIGPVVKAIIILNHIPPRFIEAPVCLGIFCRGGSLVTKIRRGLRMSRESSRRRVAKVRECFIGIQITTQTRNPLP